MISDWSKIIYNNRLLLKRQIDQLVYRLYESTEEEINIVEGKDRD
jgi:hypothetical protein